MYKPPGKHDLAGPAFLRVERGSKLISPVTYNAQDSFMSTQISKPRFSSSQGKGNTMVE